MKKSTGICKSLEEFCLKKLKCPVKCKKLKNSCEKGLSSGCKVGKKQSVKPKTVKPKTVKPKTVKPKTVKPKTVKKQSIPVAPSSSGMLNGLFSFVNPVPQKLEVKKQSVKSTVPEAPSTSLFSFVNPAPKKAEEAKKESIKTVTKKAEEAKKESIKTVTKKAEEAKKESIKTVTKKAEEAKKESIKSETKKAEEAKKESIKTVTKKAEEPSILGGLFGSIVTTPQEEVKKEEAKKEISKKEEKYVQKVFKNLNIDYSSCESLDLYKENLRQKCIKFLGYQSDTKKQEGCIATRFRWLMEAHPELESSLNTLGCKIPKPIVKKLV
jgi:hypothetical protein